MNIEHEKTDMKDLFFMEDEEINLRDLCGKAKTTQFASGITMSIYEANVIVRTIDRLRMAAKEIERKTIERCARVAERERLIDSIGEVGKPSFASEIASEIRSLPSLYEIN